MRQLKQSYQPVANNFNHMRKTHQPNQIINKLDNQAFGDPTNSRRLEPIQQADQEGPSMTGSIPRKHRMKKNSRRNLKISLSHPRFRNTPNNLGPKIKLGGTGRGNNQQSRSVPLQAGRTQRDNSQNSQIGRGNIFRLKSSRNASRSSKDAGVASLDFKKGIPQQIEDYISRRQDVQIIQHFDQYLKQFWLKSKMLNQYLYESESAQATRNAYLNRSNAHFTNGLEGIMLRLFRNGTIVPNSHDNLRAEAVEAIEKWVMSWIHRKINYETLVLEEEEQLMAVDRVLQQIQCFQKDIENEDTSF